MKFSEWVKAKQNLFEAFGAESMFNNVFRKYADKINSLMLKLDLADKTKCNDFKQEHNRIAKMVLSDCENALKELGYVGMEQGKVVINKLISDLMKLYNRAKDNAERSAMPGGCPIASPYMSLKDTGVGEKMRDLASHIRYLIEDLQKLDFAGDKSPASAKGPEEDGLMSKLFGKKGWLNPDAYASPVKRPDRDKRPTRF